MREKVFQLSGALLSFPSSSFSLEKEKGKKEIGKKGKKEFQTFVWFQIFIWKKKGKEAERPTKVVFLGLFDEAIRLASRALASGIPRNSKTIVPGRTTATQNSGEPLPEPLRVSAGRTVAALSGKTRIHSFPPRFT